MTLSLIKTHTKRQWRRYGLNLKTILLMWWINIFQPKWWATKTNHLGSATKSRKCIGINERHIIKQGNLVMKLTGKFSCIWERSLSKWPGLHIEHMSSNSVTSQKHNFSPLLREVYTTRFGNFFFYYNFLTNSLKFIKIYIIRKGISQGR